MALISEDEGNMIERLWNQGYSARQIMNMLGGTRTRNSIIGFMHRRGGYKKYREPSKLGAALPKAPPAPVAVAATPYKKRRVLDPTRRPPLLLACEDLGRNQCRYPVERDAERGHLVCGHTTAEASSWCGYHHKRCYTPIERTAPRTRAILVEQAGM